MTLMDMDGQHLDVEFFAKTLYNLVRHSFTFIRNFFAISQFLSWHDHVFLLHSC